MAHQAGPVVLPGYPDLPPIKTPSAGGMFIGASGHLFDEQIGADIYLQDIWQARTNGQMVRRVAVFCAGWGINLAAIQTADVIPGPNQVATTTPWRWETANHVRNFIALADMGQQFTAAGGGALAPSPLPHENVQPAITIMMNGLPVPSLRMNWHHKSIINNLNIVQDADEDLHYHKHHRRRAKQLSPPSIILPGTYDPPPVHVAFRRLVYTTQLQNCRRAMQ